MKVFTCKDHDGHWPVGVASVVVAESKGEATRLLVQALHEHGLDGGATFTLQELSVAVPDVRVLNEGNY